jgi:hypothetical protein
LFLSRISMILPKSSRDPDPQVRSTGNRDGVLPIPEARLPSLSAGAR